MDWLLLSESISFVQHLILHTGLALHFVEASEVEIGNYRTTGIFGRSNAKGKLCKRSAIPQDCSGGILYLVYQK